MRLRTARLLLCGVVSFGASGFIGPAAHAQDQPILIVTPQTQALAKRAAQLDCMKKLATKINGLEIDSNTHVVDFVTEYDIVRTNLDALLKGVRYGEPRNISDGSCEIDAELSVAQIVTTLTQSYDQIKGCHYDRKAIETIVRRCKETTYQVTGAGAVASADSNVTDPESLNNIVVHWLPGTHVIDLHLPEIYHKYPAQARLKAKEAAETDAQRLLLERIDGLRLSGSTTVKDFLTSHSEIRNVAHGRLTGVEDVEIRYDPDGIVEATKQITLEQIVTIIKSSCDEVYHNGAWQKEEFQDISKRNERTILTVVGTGALDISARGPAPDRAVEEPAVRTRIEEIEINKSEPRIVQ